MILSPTESAEIENVYIQNVYIKYREIDKVGSICAFNYKVGSISFISKFLHPDWSLRVKDSD